MTPEPEASVSPELIKKTKSQHPPLSHHPELLTWTLGVEPSNLCFNKPSSWFYTHVYSLTSIFHVRWGGIWNIFPTRSYDLILFIIWITKIIQGSICYFHVNVSLFLKWIIAFGIIWFSFGYNSLPYGKLIPPHLMAFPLFFFY